MAKKKTGLVMATSTDPGMIRPNNEDRVSITPEAGLAIVADGMGGHQAGEVASGIAVDVVTRHVLDVLSHNSSEKDESITQSVELQAVSDAIARANSAIFEHSQSSPQCAGMGTTIVVTLFHGNQVSIAHVGDSRLYRLRGDRLELLTEDHSLVQELVARGLITPDEARSSINKNLVTRALGIEPTVDVQLSEQALQDQDLYLLCSDGLNDVLSDQAITEILRGDPDDLHRSAKRLVAEANARGGPDNVSVVLVRTGARFSPDSAVLQKLSSELEG